MMGKGPVFRPAAWAQTQGKEGGLGSPFDPVVPVLAPECRKSKKTSPAAVTEKAALVGVVELLPGELPPNLPPGACCPSPPEDRRIPAAAALEQALEELEQVEEANSPDGGGKAARADSERGCAAAGHDAVEQHPRKNDSANPTPPKVRNPADSDAGSFGARAAVGRREAAARQGKPIAEAEVEQPPLWVGGGGGGYKGSADGLVLTENGGGGGGHLSRLGNAVLDGLPQPPVAAPDAPTTPRSILKAAGVDVLELEAIFSCARERVEDLGLQESCLEAIAALLSSKNRSAAMCRPTCIPQAFNSTHQSGSQMQELLGAWGAIEAVVGGLRHHSDIVGFQIRGLEAIGLLTWLHVGNQDRVHQHAGVPAVLQSLMCHMEEEPAVCEACLNCLCGCIRRHEANQRALALGLEGRALLRIVEAMERHRGVHREVQKEGCRLIFYMSSGRPEATFERRHLSEHAEIIAGLSGIKQILTHCANECGADKAYWLLMSLPFLPDEGERNEQ